MKEQKDLERLFQEKFKDFEVNPPQDAWSEIETRLQNKKKKRRFAPFWFKVTGIAALLALMVYFIQDSSFDNSTVPLEQNNIIVKGRIEGEQQIERESDFKERHSDGEGNIISSEEVITERSNVVQQKNSTIQLSKDLDFSTGSVVKSNENIESSKFNNGIERALIQNDIKRENKPFKEINDLSLVDEQLADSNKEDFENTYKKIDSDLKNKSEASERKSQSISKNLVFENSDREENSLNAKTNKQVVAVREESNGIIDSSKMIKYQHNLGIVKSEIEEIKDSTWMVAEVIKEANPLEELLKEKEKREDADEKEEEKRSKWVISSNASPVYFNSFSEGSPIDEQFSQNNKSYATSLSYGIGVQYAISKRLNIRTGINSLAFAYKTQDVLYAANFSGDVQVSSNVNTSSQGQNVSVYSRVADNSFGDVENFKQENEGELNQQFRYVEVPLELSFSLLDRKFGIDLIGGMSTLFLSNNSISLLTNGAEMEIGKANNLNDIHFSSNVGLGFKYNFWKSFQANFQPMFKYQINTFSENSGNFKPYFIGLYSGLSFSF
jgi:hypothetical protein